MHGVAWIRVWKPEQSARYYVVCVSFERHWER